MEMHRRSHASILEDAGITAPCSASFLKQYGERRTCTNAVRALITTCFENTFVLMHILGDKHAIPCDLKLLRSEADQSHDPAWHFISASTFGVPSSTTSRGNYAQLRFIKALSAHVLEAFDQRRFGIIICTKHPYAWAASLLRYRRWPTPIADGTWDEDAAAEFLTGACIESGKKHQSWLALHDDPSLPSVIVTSEALRSDPAAILRCCQRTFPFAKVKDGAVAGLHAEVKPALWDYVRSGIAPESRFPTPMGPPAELTARLRRVVEQNTNWSTMGTFGYYPA